MLSAWFLNVKDLLQKLKIVQNKRAAIAGICEFQLCMISTPSIAAIELIFSHSLAVFNPVLIIP